MDVVDLLSDDETSPIFQRNVGKKVEKPSNIHRNQDQRQVIDEGSNISCPIDLTQCSDSDENLRNVIYKPRDVTYIICLDQSVLQDDDDEEFLTEADIIYSQNDGPYSTMNEESVSYQSLSSRLNDKLSTSSSNTVKPSSTTTTSLFSILQANLRASSATSSSANMVSSSASSSTSSYYSSLHQQRSLPRSATMVAASASQLENDTDDTSSTTKDQMIKQNAMIEKIQKKRKPLTEKNNTTIESAAAIATGTSTAAVTTKKQKTTMNVAAVDQPLLQSSYQGEDEEYVIGPQIQPATAAAATSSTSSISASSTAAPSSTSLSSSSSSSVYATAASTKAAAASSSTTTTRTNGSLLTWVTGYIPPPLLRPITTTKPTSSSSSSSAAPPLPPSIIYEVRLLVDRREGANALILSSLQAKQVACQAATLATGDFLWILYPLTAAPTAVGGDPLLGDHVYLLPDLLLERKSIPDLASSLLDGRYLEQKTRMKSVVGMKQCGYILEGESIPTLTNAANSSTGGSHHGYGHGYGHGQGHGQAGQHKMYPSQMTGLYTRKINGSSIKTAMLTTYLEHDIHVTRTKNMDHTIAYLTYCHGLLQRKYAAPYQPTLAAAATGSLEGCRLFRDFQTSYQKTGAKSYRDLFAYQLRQIHGCGVTTAMAMVARWPTMKQWMDYLMMVGRETAVRELSMMQKKDSLQPQTQAQTENADEDQGGEEDKNDDEDDELDDDCIDNPRHQSGNNTGSYTNTTIQRIQSMPNKTRPNSSGSNSSSSSGNNNHQRILKTKKPLGKIGQVLAKKIVGIFLDDY